MQYTDRRESAVCKAPVHKDLRVSQRHHTLKKQSMVECACDPSAGEVKTGGFLRLTVQLACLLA